MDLPIRERGVYSFGSFHLDPTRRILRCCNDSVTLTARLFDLLLYLVQNHERLVARDELERAVWQSRVVGEGNLQKAISRLRKAMQLHEPAQAIIVTVPGRGFQFAMPVSFEPELAGFSTRELFPTPPASASLQLPGRWRGWWRGWWRGRGALLVVPALVLAAAIALLWRPARFAPPPNSVAIMAFTNLSGDPGQEYFSDGISEELIGALGRLNSIQVAARLSSFAFKGKPASIDEIARRLNVAAVLEGSVRRVGQQLRITAQLVSARTGYQIWSRTFDRDAGDILNIQSEIATSVAASLQVALLGGDLARLTMGGTHNPAALDAYLHGMAQGRQLTAERQRAALASFDAALALDPDYALAHMQRAITLIRFVEGYGGLGGDIAATRRYRADAIAEAARAVQLAPRLAAAHAALAGADEEAWRFTDAEAEYAAARALSPGDAVTEKNAARFEAEMGHLTQAVAAAQRGVQLDPLIPAAHVNLAETLIWARQPDAAATALDHARELGMAGPGLTDEMALIALEKHDYARVRELCAGQLDWAQDFYLAIAAHALGQKLQAADALAKLQAAQGDNAALYYAEIYGQWGDTETALHWLETAYQLHDDGLISLRTDWRADPLRNQPRFKAVERLMNFPPDTNGLKF